jgi:hypothetical protein
MWRHVFAVLMLVLSSGSVARADTVPLSDLKACGTELDLAPACKSCGATPTFVVKDAWHGLAQCLRQLRNAWNRNGPEATIDAPGAPAIRAVVRAQIMKEVSSPRVAFSTIPAGRAGVLSFEQIFTDDLKEKSNFDLMWLKNDLGQPYNAMGQTGMSYFLYHFATVAGKGGYPDAERERAFYTALARAAARTVVTDIQDGGLASREGCKGELGAQCSWYHSITRRDMGAGAGGTLNQMLHAIRDLGLLADSDVETDPGIRALYDQAVDAGLNQLFYKPPRTSAREAPALQDFESPDDIGPHKKRAYYGMNVLSPKTAGGGYFLKFPEKNCGYQIHVLQLFAAIIERQEKKGRKDVASRDWLACQSSLIKFYVAAKAWTASDAPMEASGLFSCPKDSKAQMDKLARFYDQRTAACER